MPWKPLVYALLCVVAPVAWGLMVYWASGRIERRVLRKPRPSSNGSAPDDVGMPLDYHI